MYKIKMNNIEKSFGNREIFNIKSLQVNSGEKIGIVGKNGSGKTSLLKIILGEDSDFKGSLEFNKDSSFEYVSQLEEAKVRNIDGKYASMFGISSKYDEAMSGGEKTRFKIAHSFSQNPDILALDEPTSNLDLEGIKLISKNLAKFKSTLIIVSHDRELLDRVCNKIWEIDNGEIKVYSGNYSKYQQLKKEEVTRKEMEYENYMKEKNRLINAKENVAKKSEGIKKTPKRMGNSEARLHRMGGQKNKMKLDNTTKAMESRIDKLEVKEKPKKDEIIKLNLLEGSKIYSKVLLESSGINKAYESKKIFIDGKFQILNGKKIGLIGENGSGKTTFINMIINGEFKQSDNLKIGYFSQTMDILDEEKTILENVMETGIYDENFTRLILARLLFRGERAKEKVEGLSGGERVKVSLAKIVLQDVNFLILDEPTNYLDIESLKVLEEILKNYEGNILIVSHDKRFLDNIVDELLIIKDKKIEKFTGNLREYENKPRKVKKSEKDNLNQKMILENEIAEILGKLSFEENKEIKKELDEKYIEKLRTLRNL